MASSAERSGNISLAEVIQENGYAYTRHNKDKGAYTPPEGMRAITLGPIMEESHVVKVFVYNPEKVVAEVVKPRSDVSKYEGWHRAYGPEAVIAFKSKS